MKPRRPTRWPLLLLTTGVVACQTPARQSDPAALIVESDEQSRSELQQVVSTMLGLPDVLLADDAFTKSSDLLIERNAAYDASSMRITGRDSGKPQVFRLSIRDGACVLTHAVDGRHVALVHARCKAVQD